MNSEYLFYNKESKLNFFFEPKPNKTEVVSSYFLTLLGYPKGYKVNYTINRDGLNQKSNYATKKDEDILRIITIGDSFTFGQNVNTDENYPSQLESLLNQKCANANTKKYEVLNLGVGAYDIQYIIERYKLRGAKYKPDLILWFVIGDDLRRINEIQMPILVSLRNQLRQNGGKMASALDKISRNTWGQALNKIDKILGGEENVLKKQKLYLSNLNLYYQKNLVVFTFDSTMKKYKDLLREFSKSRRKIYYYDKIPDIYSNQRYYLYDHHPTKEGYKLIVEDLFKYLVKNKLVPCGSK